MNSLRYIHAADLHLDTPFLGLSRTDAGEALQAQLRDATFTALQRLFDQCERLRPDFSSWPGTSTTRKSTASKPSWPCATAVCACRPAGIPVFWAHRQP